MLYIFENTDELNESILEKTNSLLSIQRQQKVDSLRMIHDKINSTLVYLMLCFGLKNEYGIKTLPVFGSGKNGKPFLYDYEKIYFNLSHCRNSCACIISDSETAVDIADYRKISDNTAKYFCTNEQFTDAEKSDDKAKALVRLWAMKECFSKISGDGLLMDFKTITEKNFKQIKCIDSDRYFTAYYSEKDTKVKKIVLSDLLDT